MYKKLITDDFWKRATKTAQ